MSNDMRVFILVVLSFAIVVIVLFSIENRSNFIFWRETGGKEDVIESAVVEDESEAPSARSSDFEWARVFGERSDPDPEDSYEFEWAMPVREADFKEEQRKREEEQKKREEELAMKSMIEQFLTEAEREKEWQRAQEEQRTRALEAEAIAMQEQVEQLRRLEWLELNRIQQVEELKMLERYRQQEQAEALWRLKIEMEYEMNDIRRRADWAEVMAEDAASKVKELERQR